MMKIGPDREYEDEDREILRQSNVNAERARIENLIDRLENTKRHIMEFDGWSRIATTAINDAIDLLRKRDR